MSYEKAVKLLTSQGKFFMNLGLERISTILGLLGNPQDELEYIHVAGTNGKGSVCAILASVLTVSGKKVGLYTSPHILDYTERIKINSDDISKQDFANEIGTICDLADENDIHLTEFEILTAAAFNYFAKNNVDIVVLETGLGGRLDATNVIKKNLCSIITHIDLDHTERLGKTKDKIAYEKAGIIKPNCPVLTSEGYEAIKDEADKNDSLFVLVSPSQHCEELSLKGLYQQENLSLALAALELLYRNMSKETIEKGLSLVKHPFRFQYIKEKNMIIDGSHNPNGTCALRESLDYYYPSSKRRFIFGCLNNKDYEKMMKNLFQKGDEIYFYNFDNPNSCTFEELQAVCEFKAQNAKDCLLELKEGNETFLTVICGSFYMLKELL